MYVCACMHSVSETARRGRLLELGLIASEWVLGFEPWLCGRATRALNYRAVSPAPAVLFLGGK